jgi:hypothetical protein
MKSVVWTPQMLKRLVDYYPLLFNEALAKMLGVSQRTMARKASELGLKKPDDFMQRKADDYSRKMSASLKKAYAAGRKVSQFKPGVRNNPEGEFRKGFRFTGDIEADRVDKIRRTFKRNKLLMIYGLQDDKTK